jgi:hypothetical protein
MRDPQVTENAALAELRKHPAWPILRQHFEDKQNEDALSLAHSLIWDSKPVDQRKLDEARGRWRAYRQILGTPDLAAKRLEKLTKEDDRVHA